MKIALIQMAANANKQQNSDKAAAFVKQAASKGARLVCLPEVFIFRGNQRDKQTRLSVVESLQGKTVTTFAKLAYDHRCWINLGSILEKSADHKAFNTNVMIDPKGKVRAKYRKIHLFDATINGKIVREADCLRPGTSPKVVTVDNLKAGLSICYDLRFADMYAKYRRQKVDMIFVPSCFTRLTGQAHWEVLLRARAIESLAYVLAANQVGDDWRGVKAHGHSMVVDPWGKVMAQASGDKEEIVYATLDLEAIKKARSILPGIV